jgi:L-aminopeptidase/D-esterase-like protein
MGVTLGIAQEGAGAVGAGTVGAGTVGAGKGAEVGFGVGAGTGAGSVGLGMVVSVTVNDIVLTPPSNVPPAFVKLWADTVRVCCPSVILGQE